MFTRALERVLVVFYTFVTIGEQKKKKKVMHLFLYDYALHRYDS